MIMSAIEFKYVTEIYLDAGRNISILSFKNASNFCNFNSSYLLTLFCVIFYRAQGFRKIPQIIESGGDSKVQLLASIADWNNEIPRIKF
jgi:hypothetical protein